MSKSRNRRIKNFTYDDIPAGARICVHWSDGNEAKFEVADLYESIVTDKNKDTLDKLLKLAYHAGETETHDYYAGADL